jgi:hypothetical protein
MLMEREHSMARVDKEGSEIGKESMKMPPVFSGIGLGWGMWGKKT